MMTITIIIVIIIIIITTTLFKIFRNLFTLQ